MTRPSRAFDPAETALRLAAGPRRKDRLTHLEIRPARPAEPAGWPRWAHPTVVDSLTARGVERLWSHQRAAAELAWAGRHTVVSTGTASGKSLAYLIPALSAIAASVDAPGARGDTVLYLSPTKALARDQLASVQSLAVPGVRAAAFDGDSTPEERDWARHHATYIMTNPDMLHRTMLPGHARWAQFWSTLRYVVVDECHYYRGVFGGHVAQILRRLRRIAVHHGSAPTFVLASATVADPDVTASRLVGEPVVAVTSDGAPHGVTALALWEPPLTALVGEQGAPVRRSAIAESADLVADLVAEGVPTLAFVRSRHGAEILALQAKAVLADVDPALPAQVAPYRGGYLPEDRREIERQLRAGELMAVAATNALELGIDIAGLDAVVMAGYPGTRSSLWQQVGRAGRGSTGGLGVLVARDDPLDTYLVTHPDVLLDAPVEATVFDSANPYIVAPHLCAAAQELPLTDEDLEMFDGDTAALVASLVEAGYLRRRTRGWFWTRRDRAADLADIRSSGGNPVRVVEASTGRLVGTVDTAAADTSVHAGAVYVHFGETYLVESYDVVDGIALVDKANPDYSTSARVRTEIGVVEPGLTSGWDEGKISFGTVDVSAQAVGYLKRRVVTGQVLGEEPLDLPARHLRTKAVWWTLTDERVAEAGIAAAAVPGAVHAAEHAAIGLLPLFATCDRWDIGGVSTALHPDTGRLTVFVYDGHPGGAGFAERGYAVAQAWLSATRDAIIACRCDDGCPSCVQSPKCGNANSPLDKWAAVSILTALLAGAG
ncbi:MAG: DEAD/DEAH box helicase, partial [Actinomycetota bacterium]|nr:DEAD/DEAH box helicase [Actinomycetota bacterium]